MNITHSKEEIIQGDMLSAIFQRQSELMEKYHHIEARSGLLQTEDCPVNINCKRGQARLKDFAWRLTEELGEALDTWYDHNCELNNLHFQEELVDALHFFTEYTILTGYTPQQVLHPIDNTDMLEGLFNLANNHICDYTLEEAVSHFIRQIAMTCNTLKNKPWKQTQMMTDKIEFEKRLTNSWVAFARILIKAGLTAEMTAILYLKKSQVNFFRQRTNY